MMTNGKQKPNNIKAGTTITGKWHDERYTILRQLGSGAIGTVYHCVHNGHHRALKIGVNGSSLITEVNVLKSLQKVQGVALGPLLFDVDDWVAGDGQVYTFYVMEYLNGESVRSFIKRHGERWVGTLLLKLLADLEKLHQSGWVFGDLKSDNLLVVANPVTLRWVDVGGTTQMGRAIKEYTEFFDRGFWGLGSRRADPGYDLFAFVMVFLDVFYPRRFKKGAHPEKQLLQNVQAIPALNRYYSSFRKAIQGKYATSSAMKQDIAARLRQDHVRAGGRTASHSKYKQMRVELTGLTVLTIIYYVSSLFLP